MVRPLSLTESPNWKVGATCVAAGLPLEIAERGAARLRERFAEVEIACDARSEQWPGGPGMVVSVRLDGGPVPTLVTALGERGKRAEAVADEAITDALAFRSSGRAVDPHGADQIALPLAFADGESAFTVSEITRHLLTNIDVIRAFRDTYFEIEGQLGSPGTVRVVPEGYNAHHC